MTLNPRLLEIKEESQELNRLVALFREQNPEVMDEEAVRGQCLQWSCEFAEFLEEEGMTLPLRHDGAWPVRTYWVRGVRHHCLEVEGRVYDWTIRQFYPDAHVPGIDHWPPTWEEEDDPT